MAKKRPSGRSKGSKRTGGNRTGSAPRSQQDDVPGSINSGGDDNVVTTTETSAAAAAALAAELGIAEEEAWELINAAAAGEGRARERIAGVMGGLGEQSPSMSATGTTGGGCKASTAGEGSSDGVGVGRELLRGAMRVISGCNKEQHVVHIPGFLNDEDIAAIDATPSMPESIEAGRDGCFLGLVGGDRYTDAEGLSIFGSAKHRSWRIESALEKVSAALSSRLSRAMAAVDTEHWGSLRPYIELQYVCEVEYISYDASVEGSRPSLAPHVDNGAKVTIVALLRDERSFEGGANFFGGGARGGARSYRMKRGDALFFRGECVEHWISHVEAGRRDILQVEMHVHENRAAAKLVQQAEHAKKAGNTAYGKGELDRAMGSYESALKILVDAERAHPGESFGAHLEVSKMGISVACLLNQAAVCLKRKQWQPAVDFCSSVTRHRCAHSASAPCWLLRVNGLA